MAENSYRYVIVGAGLAGASAVAGIREHDTEGTILLIGDEDHRPYHRPPLSKGLWLGKKTLDQVYVKPEAYYAEAHVDLRLNTSIVNVSPEERTLLDADGRTYRYEKLLLATGGSPRRLEMLPGGDLEGVCYYRYLDDYLHERALADPERSATIIGGGFIGSEMAAALSQNQIKVTVIFPDDYLGARVFPEELGRRLTTLFAERGVTMMSGDAPTAFAGSGSTYLTQTRNGRSVEGDLIIVGIGIRPQTDLAERGGLAVGNGIIVNEYLQTSHPDIYAAGDNAYFPSEALQTRMRVEHWDNALHQGKTAGRNMAGGHDRYTYMPYFFSDLYEFGYEAVGTVNASLQTYADWQTPYETGVIYYLEDGLVRGIMCCNVWDKMDAARALIRERTPISDPATLRGAIPFS